MIQENVNRILKSKRMQASELQTRLQLTKPAYYSILKGNPTLKNLQRIADALNVPISELLQPATPQEKQSAIICPHCGKQITIIASKPEK